LDDYIAVGVTFPKARSEPLNSDVPKKKVDKKKEREGKEKDKGKRKDKRKRRKGYM
jgi:hypothetical protein